MATRATSHHVLHETHGERDGLRTSEESTRLIRRLAERQHGVVARRQLLAIGFGKGLIQDRLRSGHLLTLHRGVYALGHRRLGIRGEWMAAVLATGPNSVLSHGSAAHLWDLRRSRGPIEVTRGSGGTRRVGVRLHQATLPAVDMAIKTEIPVTSVERTLLDIASRLDERQLERAVVAADRSGRLSWSTLYEVIDRGRRRVGVGRLRRVVLAVDPSAVEARSPLEVDFLGLCREAGLPSPSINVWVEGRLVDFLWPTERVIVEADGYRYHRDRLAFERDHESTAALTAAGYTVHRATYKMLDREPARFIGLVRRSLESSASRLA